MKQLLFILVALASALGCGCSGINASKSFSPLDFLLPGLMQNAPPSPTIPSGTNTAPLVVNISNMLPQSTFNDKSTP